MHLSVSVVPVLVHLLSMVLNSDAISTSGRTEGESNLVRLERSTARLNKAALHNDADAESGKQMTEILDNLLQGYDKRLRPNFGGEPVEVGITMYILSISALSEYNMDYTMQFYFRQLWKDPRLKFNGPEGIQTIASSFMSSIWLPDTFFVNEKRSENHNIPASQEFVRIAADGSVLWSTKLTSTLSCPMNLQMFPFDSQLCSLEIESFGYSDTDIHYKWNKGLESVGISGDVSLPAFKVLGHRQKKFHISLTTGNYSRLACEIQFVRAAGYYLTQTFIPAILMVVTSWIAFWINRNLIPTRVGVGITTVLALSALSVYTNVSIPKIAYFKAIDMYLGISITFAFLSLLVTCTVGYLSKQILTRYQNLEKEGVPSGPIGDMKICGVSPRALDKWCRILFPLSFLLFNVLFCIIYSFASDSVEDDLVLIS